MNYECGNAEQKNLERTAKGIVPDGIIKRKKAGFGAPYRKWLRYDLQELWDDISSESAERSRGWFDYKGLQDIRRQSQTGKGDYYML